MARKDWTVKKAGIFCLETAVWDEESWDKKVKDQDSLDQHSYEHFLRFLETSSISASSVRIPYRHFDVATKRELVFYLEKWKEKNIQEHFPILFLAFHGDEKSIGMFDGKEATSNELANILYDEDYNDAFIHFSSCYHVKPDNKPDKMEKLLYNTGTLSVSGYTNGDVGWHQPLAFELLYLTKLFAFESPETKEIGPPTKSSEMCRWVNEYFATNKEMKALAELLGFHMWYRDNEYNLDTDEHPGYITPCPVKELEQRHS